MAYLQSIAIFGAGGNVGSGITRALLAHPNRPKHVVAVTREASTTTFDPAVEVRKANLEDRASVAAALKGVQAVVITLPIDKGIDTELLLIDAAADAGVQYIVPNEFGSDTAHPLVQEIPINAQKIQALQKAEERGIKWFAIVTNPWFEYAFGGISYGIDIKNRTARLWDDGTQKTRLSSLANPGKAVAALLTAPLTAPSGVSLEKYTNKHVYTSDIYASQHDILASIQRATGTTDADWKVSYAPVAADIEAGKKAFFGGDFGGLLNWLYGLMFQKGAGQYEGRDIANEDLKLAPADLDALARSAVQGKREAGEL